MSRKISDVKAREIIDCRGFPTVEVDIWVDGKFTCNYIPYCAISCPPKLRGALCFTWMKEQHWPAS